MIDRWDSSGRYKKIVPALVKQCEDEGLTVEEAKYVFELASGEVSRQGMCVSVTLEGMNQNRYKDAHTK